MISNLFRTRTFSWSGVSFASSNCTLLNFNIHGPKPNKKGHQTTQSLQSLQVKFMEIKEDMCPYIVQHPGGLLQA